MGELGSCGEVVKREESCLSFPVASKTETQLLKTEILVLESDCKQLHLSREKASSVSLLVWEWGGREPRPELAANPAWRGGPPPHVRAASHVPRHTQGSGGALGPGRNCRELGWMALISRIPFSHLGCSHAGISGKVEAAFMAN